MIYVLLNFPENKAVGVMKPGHVFTIEPMICEGECNLCMNNNLYRNRSNEYVRKLP